MTRRLVLVHGRSQAGKDPAALKAEWLDALGGGLEQNGLTLPIDEADVRLAYYGDTLQQLVNGDAPEHVSDVIIRGDNVDPAERKFFRDVLREVVQQAGLTDEQFAEADDDEIIERGPQNWPAVQVVLQVVDRYVPFASAASIALITHDVYLYLRNSAIRQAIDEGVRAAFTPDTETVVVAHSLRTVVAYNLLRQQGSQLGWRIRDFITVGSPLAVAAIRKTLVGFSPIRCPQCALSWFNALDARDIVALYPLTPERFPLNPALPAIENKRNVRNHTANRHGISGYLQDADVARRIHTALTT